MITIDTLVEELPYENAYDYYKRVTDNGNAVSLLMESLTRDPRYGRQSIVVPAPAVQINGYGSQFYIKALNSAGTEIVAMLAHEMPDVEEEFTGSYGLTDKERLRMPGPISSIRKVLNAFDVRDEHAGLYGAFSYDFVRQTEKIEGRIPKFGGARVDFDLFLPTEVVVFDENRRKAVKKRFNFSDAANNQVFSPMRLGNSGVASHDLSEEIYIQGVENLLHEIRNGEIIQAVLSMDTSVPLTREPVESYADLRRRNPSPYSFFFNLGDQQALYGASPELHVKVRGKDVEIRPLAGTIRRSGNAISDYNARVKLLTDEKELREHRMLVDLARNDIARFSDGVHVEEFLGIESYPNLYHLGSGVRGTLRDGFDGLDAVVATLPAGTLSGAPKVRAMQLIEHYEGSRRGYYGGCVGYLSFNGDVNTGITIRSVYVSDEASSVRAGAGIVHHSNPEKELQEVKLKAENQLRVLGVGD